MIQSQAKRRSQPDLIHRLLPFITWLKDYRAEYLKNDAIAGLTVSVVLIPQAMAYAALAGLPPIYGLYAAAVTPFIAALWGGMPQLATGPIAIMSLLVMTNLAEFAAPGSPEFIELTFMTAAMVGVFYLLIGFLRFGFIMSFISHAAVKGFTSAAALIITSTQLPQLMGVSVERHEFFFEVFWEIALAVPSVHGPTLGIGLLCLAIIYGVRKLDQRLPAGLIALSVASTAVYFLGLEERGVALVGSGPAGLPGFHLPLFQLDLVSDLVGPTIIMAMVSFAETFSVSKAVAAQTGRKFDVDQEFVAQGLANLVGSFFQCCPVSGSFSRTAVNFSAGAKTAVSSVIASLGVVVVLLFFTPILGLIPKAALAALVISAVLTLFHPRQVVEVWRVNRDDGAVALAVFIVSLLIKPDYALMLGISMSLIFFLWKTMHPRIVIETKDPTLNMFLNAEEADRPTCPQIVFLRVDNPIYFANAEYTMEHIADKFADSGPAVKVLLLDFQAVSFIDGAGLDELRSLKDDLDQQGVVTAVSDYHQPVYQALARVGLAAGERALSVHRNKYEAVSRVAQMIDHDYCRDRCPHSLFYECPELKGQRRDLAEIHRPGPATPDRALK